MKPYLPSSLRGNEEGCLGRKEVRGREASWRTEKADGVESGSAHFDELSRYRKSVTSPRDH